MNRSRRLLAATLAVVALVGVVTFANAASLPVSSAALTSAAVGHPCNGTATATAVTGSGATYSAVSVTLPAGCVNRQVTLRMTSGTTTLTGTAQVDASSVAVVSFAPTTYNPTSAWTIVAVVDGWNMPTTWSFTLPPIWCTVTGSSGATCTATVAQRTTSAGVRYYDIVVSTTSETWVPWEVSFNFGHTFYGGVPVRLGNSDLDDFSDGQITWSDTTYIDDVTRVSACSAKPVLTVEGLHSGRDGYYQWQGWNRVWVSDPNWFDQVRSDRERRFSLVIDQTQAGYSDVVSPTCGW